MKNVKRVNARGEGKKAQREREGGGGEKQGCASVGCEIIILPRANVRGEGADKETVHRRCRKKTGSIRITMPLPENFSFSRKKNPPLE